MLKRNKNMYLHCKMIIIVISIWRFKYHHFNLLYSIHKYMINSMSSCKHNLPYYIYRLGLIHFWNMLNFQSNIISYAQYNNLVLKIRRAKYFKLLLVWACKILVQLIYEWKTIYLYNLKSTASFRIPCWAINLQKRHFDTIYQVIVIRL